MLVYPRNLINGKIIIKSDEKKKQYININKESIVDH